MAKTEIQVKFFGKEFHEKKSFADDMAALDFIRRNREKIDCVNYKSIHSIFGGDISHFELLDIIKGKEPRTW